MSSAEQHSLTYPEFWEAARSGRLELQRCRRCAQLRYFPAAICPSCLSIESDWEVMSGEATLYAYTTVHRAPNASFAKEAPYTVAIVDLSEGVRMMGRLEGGPQGGSVIGVSLVFDGVGDSGAGPWLRFSYKIQGRNDEQPG